MRIWQEIRARQKLMSNVWTVMIQQQREIQDLQRAALAAQEGTLAVAEGWLLSLDAPERQDEIRENVIVLVEALRNDLAQLQEHVV